MKALFLSIIVLFSLTSLAEEISGVGLVISEQNGNTQINGVLSGGPADLGGLQTQEIIQSVDNLPIRGLDLNRTVQLIRGPQGSLVTLTLSDESGVHERSVTL